MTRPISDSEDFKAQLSEQGSFTPRQIEEGCRIWSRLPPESKTPEAIQIIAETLREMGRQEGDLSQKKIIPRKTQPLADLKFPPHAALEDIAKILQELGGVSEWIIDKLKIYVGENQDQPLPGYLVKELIHWCEILAKAEAGEYSLDNLLTLLQMDLRLSDEDTSRIKEAISPPEKGWLGGAVALFRSVFEGEEKLSREQIDQAFLLAKALQRNQKIEWVRYDDAQGKLREHFVITDRVPLPSAYNDLPGEQIDAINNLDYRLDLNGRDIQNILTENNAAVRAVKEKASKTVEAASGLEHLPEGNGVLPIEHENQKAVIVYTSPGKNSGAAASIGFTHQTMEDRHLVRELTVGTDQATLTAVFDGHGGKGCSAFAEENFLKCFQRRLESPPLNGLSQEVKIYNALCLALVDLSRSYQGKDGSTANVCLRIGNELWVANLGDSRAILVTPAETLPLSKDQKAAMPEIKEYIYARGGYTLRNHDHEVINHPQSSYTIMPGRCLGDHELRGGIFSRPIITKYNLAELPKPCTLIQVCDGVTDVLTSEQIGKFTRQLPDKKPEQVACAITRLALNCQSGDNITTLVTEIK